MSVKVIQLTSCNTERMLACQQSVQEAAAAAGKQAQKNTWKAT